MRFSKEKVIQLHQLVMNQSGGLNGVRDMDLLDSALSAVYQTFDGQELYPTIEEKAARLGYNLISNHAFIDGNKRIGVLVMLTFLELNGIQIKCNNKELVELGFKIAEGIMKYNTILDWVNNHKVYKKKNDDSLAK